MLKIFRKMIKSKLFMKFIKTNFKMATIFGHFFFISGKYN